MEKKYKITREIIDYEIELKLSYDELRVIRNGLDQLNQYQRGLNTDLHDLRDFFNEALKRVDNYEQ